jgi:hypothetical protein
MVSKNACELSLATVGKQTELLGAYGRFLNAPQSSRSHSLCSRKLAKKTDPAKPSFRNLQVVDDPQRIEEWLIPVIPRAKEFVQLSALHIRL